jgi:hypothetical protein
MTATAGTLMSRGNGTREQYFIFNTLTFFVFFAIVIAPRSRAFGWTTHKASFRSQAMFSTPHGTRLHPLRWISTVVENSYAAH